MHVCSLIWLLLFWPFLQYSSLWLSAALSFNSTFNSHFTTSSLSIHFFAYSSLSVTASFSLRGLVPVIQQLYQRVIRMLRTTLWSTVLPVFKPIRSYGPVLPLWPPWLLSSMPSNTALAIKKKKTKQRKRSGVTPQLPCCVYHCNSRGEAYLKMIVFLLI